MHVISLFLVKNLVHYTWIVCDVGQRREEEFRDKQVSIDGSLRE